MILILHGWQGSDAPHWQSWLHSELERHGVPVLMPALPDRDTPDCLRWLETLEDIMTEHREIDRVVCHSLGCTLWMHAAARGLPYVVEEVALVAPPGIVQLEACASEVRGFLPIPLDRKALAGVSRKTRLVCTLRDPFCIEGAATLFGHSLGLEVDLLPDACGHINVAGGFGPWPAMRDWCMGRSGRVQQWQALGS